DRLRVALPPRRDRGRRLRSGGRGGVLGHDQSPGLARLRADAARPEVTGLPARTLLPPRGPPLRVRPAHPGTRAPGDAQPTRSSARLLNAGRSTRPKVPSSSFGNSSPSWHEIGASRHLIEEREPTRCTTSTSWRPGLPSWLDC